ncbi:proton-coupled folate transporter-like [Mercenaria mercenaria]|uniref:proton-coupled folate transporter-like n=1 Tax=Mercenaria mercenaria TaxID=6596 RepID=UPI00234F68CD|nr:proton-coupled folate transporter-like [Mercenaria mercenaria]
MCCSEKDPLMQKDEKMYLDKSKHISLRLAGPLTVSFLSYMAIWINTYATSEWIQHRIKVQMFENETLTDTSSSCNNHSNPDYAKLEKVQQETARWQMYLTMTIKSIALVTTFFYTVYTDLIGRKFLFILSCFSITLYFFLSSLVILFDLHFIFLLLASVIYALTGTSYGLLAVGYSYIADITLVGKQRAMAFFAMDVSISVSGTIGALVSGYYIEAMGFIYPSFTSAAIAFLGLLVAIFCVPESMKDNKKIQRPPLKQSILRPFEFYVSKKFKGSRLLYIMLLFAFIFADMTGVHRKTIEALYQLGMPFCWSPSKIGIFATLNATSANVLGTLFLKGFQYCISNIVIALISITTSAGAFVLEALASTDIMLYLVALPACLINIASPLIRSTMSTMTSKQNQGALSASLLVVQTICSFVAGYADNSVYAATLPFFNGFIFLVFAGYCVLSALFLMAYIWIKKIKDKMNDMTTTVNVLPDDGVKQRDSDGDRQQCKV